MENKKTTRAIGKEFEDLACNYLEKQGLKFLQANYFSKLGEIDLIMQDKDFRVFVEVRYRKRKDYGEPLATVSKKKQRNIIRTALFYLQENNLFEKIACRFDVVAVQYNHDGINIEWIKSAFDNSK